MIRQESFDLVPLKFSLGDALGRRNGLSDKPAKEWKVASRDADSEVAQQCASVLSQTVATDFP